MKRLPTIVEQRVVFRKGQFVRLPYLIGHGQQLARKRLAAHIQATGEVRKTPLSEASRQVQRQIARAAQAFAANPKNRRHAAGRAI